MSAFEKKKKKKTKWLVLVVRYFPSYFSKPFLNHVIASPLLFQNVSDYLFFICSFSFFFGLALSRTEKHSLRALQRILDHIDFSRCITRLENISRGYFFLLQLKFLLCKCYSCKQSCFKLRSITDLYAQLVLT